MALKILIALTVLFICLKYMVGNSRKLKKMTVPGFTRYYGVLYKIQENKTTTSNVKKVIRIEPFRQNLKVKLLKILTQLSQFTAFLLYFWAILVNVKNFPLCFGLVGFSLLLFIPIDLLPTTTTYNYWAHKKDAQPNIVIPTRDNHAREMKIRYQLAGCLLIIGIACISVML